MKGQSLRASKNTRSLSKEHEHWIAADFTAIFISPAGLRTAKWTCPYDPDPRKRCFSHAVIANRLFLMLLLLFSTCRMGEESSSAARKVARKGILIGILVGCYESRKEWESDS
nr:hypothetical protein Iba_chr12dCG18200 [Ipomoea batatas]